MGSRSHSVGAALLGLSLSACAGTTISTTLDQAPAAIRLACEVSVVDDTALFAIALIGPTTFLELGEGDHFAARRGDGSLTLLAPYLAGEASDGGSWKRYAASVSGNGEPRLAWSRGSDPYAWVSLASPPPMALKVERGDVNTITWSATTSTAPDTQTELWTTCETASEIGGCPSGADGAARYCGVRRTFPPETTAAPLPDIVTPKPGEPDVSKCKSLVVIATRTERVDVRALGLAQDATCTTRRSSTLKFAPEAP